ncbi:MAG: hypothetical protein ACFFHV_20260 [Promethearchaeota archaeon]
MAFSTNEIIALVIGGLLAGILLPLGLTDLVNISNASVTVNGSATTFGAIAPASIVLILGTVIPLVIGIAVMKGFLR